MEKQIDLFEAIEIADKDEEAKIKNEHTTSQWELYKALKATAGRKLSQVEMLEMLPIYGYHEELAEHPKRQFNNLSSARWLRSDIKALRGSTTIFKIVVDGKIANTISEAKKFLLKKKIRALTGLRDYYDEMEKLSLDGQMRMTYHNEKDRIESVLRIEKEELARS